MESSDLRSLTPKDGTKFDRNLSNTQTGWTDHPTLYQLCYPMYQSCPLQLVMTFPMTAPDSKWRPSMHLVPVTWVSRMSLARQAVCIPIVPNYMAEKEHGD